MSQQALSELRQIIEALRKPLGEETYRRLDDVHLRLQKSWEALKEQAQRVEYVAVVTDPDEIPDMEVDVDLEELSEPMGGMMPELQVSTKEVPRQQLVELLPETDLEDASTLNAEEFLNRINGQVENFARDLKVSPRVLVVEDDTESQEQLVARLAEHEILADLAMSGEEAIDRLSEKAYAVCVVGQCLPDLSGVELVRKIRDGWPLMEILACVHADDVHRAEACLHAGASDYLPFPYPSSHYLNMKIRLSQARHDFETRVNAVIQHLSSTMSRLAKERGPKVLNSYIQSLKRTLESYEENAPDLRIVVLGPPQLIKSAGTLGHQVLEVKSSKEIEDMVRMGMAQVVVVVDNPGQTDGVELIYRLRQVSTTVGIFVVSTEMRLQNLVEAVGTTIGDFLLRPLEGRELFLPRLEKLINRQKQMTRYRLLLEELKVMNINLMNPAESL